MELNKCMRILDVEELHIAPKSEPAGQYGRIVFSMAIDYTEH